MAARRIGSIRSRGPNTWQLVAPGGTDRRTGKRRQLTRTFRGTRAAAEKELIRFIADCAAGHIDSTTATVAQLLDEWMAIAGPEMSPSSRGDFHWYIDVHIKPRIGTIAVQKLEAHHLQRLYADLRNNGGRCRLGPKRKCPPATYPCEHGGGAPLSAATVKRVHVIVHAALEQACIWRWIPRNPADDLKRAKQTKVKRAKPVPAEAADVARLSAWLRVHDPELWCFVVLTSRRGARPGEVCALRWSDIDLAAGVIVFARTIARNPRRAGRADGEPAWVEKETKADDERRLELVGHAHEAVVAHRRASAERALALGLGLPARGRVFHHGSEDRPWQPGNIARRLQRARKAAGVGGAVTFRALRHYVATRLISSGEDVRTVAGILGHARPSTTLDIYTDWVPGKDGAASLLLDAEIDGAVTR